MNDEEAPSATNIVENPIMKANVLPMAFDRRGADLSSARESPVTNERYAGTSGKTQGERNERTPAKKDRVKETSFIARTPRCRLLFSQQRGAGPQESSQDFP